MKAKEVLKAIRVKYNQSAVIREVSVRDPFETARYNQYRLDRYPSYYGQLVAQRPTDFPLAPIPDGWVPDGVKFERRIDALVIDKHRTAVEIKVTRADFNTETEEKRAPWRHYTNKFVYAVPTGLIAPDEVPDYAGLWYVDEVGYRTSWNHGVTVAKKAKINKNAADLPDYLVKSLLGRLSRYEHDREKEGK